MINWKKRTALESRISYLEEELANLRRASEESTWNVYLKAARATIERQKEQIKMLTNGGATDSEIEKGVKIGYLQDDMGNIRVFDVTTGLDIKGVIKTSVNFSLHSACTISLEAYVHDADGDKVIR